MGTPWCLCDNFSFSAFQPFKRFLRNLCQYFYHSTDRKTLLCKSPQAVIETWRMGEITRWKTNEHHRISYRDILMWQCYEASVEIKILWSEKQEIGSRASIFCVFGLLPVTNVQLELQKWTFMWRWIMKVPSYCAGNIVCVCVRVCVCVCAFKNTPTISMFCVTEKDYKTFRVCT